MLQTKKIYLLEKKIPLLKKQLEHCNICPRRCNINRKKGERGVCQASNDLVVYSAMLHKGEEPPISGRRGSGAIFFSGCNLKCIYCQNYKFSHQINGKILTPKKLSDIMLNMQNKGARNINLITPSHMLPQIAETLLIAFRKGLNLPIVYNTSGYENVEILKILRGIIDIYLTDMKYINSLTSYDLSKAKDYPGINQKAILEMYSQKKNSQFVNKIMKKGLIIRHLILPGYINESKEILIWLKNNVPLAYVSLMSQYQPYYKAYLYPKLKKRINISEYTAMQNFIKLIGIEKGWFQKFNPEEKLAGIHIVSNL